MTLNRRACNTAKFHESQTVVLSINKLFWDQRIKMIYIFYKAIPVQIVRSHIPYFLQHIPTYLFRPSTAHFQYKNISFPIFLLNADLFIDNLFWREHPKDRSSTFSLWKVSLACISQIALRWKYLSEGLVLSSYLLARSTFEMLRNVKCWIDITAQYH